MNTLIKTGVIGHPIKHSKSPLIHTYWLQHYGLNGQYEALDIPPEILKNKLPYLLQEGGYTGFNLTIPHKEIAFDLCDVLDPAAQQIGAVNTLIKRADGSIFGTNTDAFGFIQNIRQQKPDFDFTAGRAVVLGAGGAARAILYGLLQQGVREITLLNRTQDKAEVLAKALDPALIKTQPWADRDQAVRGAHLVVNTTALGMMGQAPLELTLQDLAPGALVCDIVYAPLMTDLLLQAQARGYETVTGIGMLLHQARPAFELWYGTLPDVTSDLERLVLS